MARVAGICFIKVDGAQLQVKGSVEIPLTNVKRENVMSLSGSAGYKETTEAAFIKVTVIITPDFPRDKIMNGTDMTITAELANGTVYTLSGAYLTDAASLKADEGEAELNFSGTRGEFQ